MRTVKLVIEYDGTNYLGWQVQPRGLTVQGVIEEKLSLLTGETIRLTGSGRTDAGAHAYGQVAHFKTKSPMEVRSIQKALNSLLPADIAVQKAEEAGEEFHARKSARSKVYEYRILNRDPRPALFRGYAWHISQKLDLEEMKRSAQYLVGEHDFSCFRSVGTPTRTAIRRVEGIDWKRSKSGVIQFKIEASGFLKQMVRAIVGTLVEVGKGRIQLEEFLAILESRDRKRAGPTAPAHGLFLKEVKY
jgi:tRNA pseudouridine38-40 synthase